MSQVVYSTVRGRVGDVRPKSVFFAVGSVGEKTVPRALIHAEDCAALDGMMAGTETALRIETWKARELGFVTGREEDAASGDLFQNMEGDGT